MSDAFNRIIVTSVQNQEQGSKLLEKLTTLASPSSVFSAPVDKGEYTVITASEVTVSLGYGFGTGGGSSPMPAGENNGSAEAQNASGGGGGGGGGGTSLSRPVAAVIIGPNGVRVEPIVDPTKISLTMFGGLFRMMPRLMWMRRRREKR